MISSKYRNIILFAIGLAFLVTAVFSSHATIFSHPMSHSGKHNQAAGGTSRSSAALDRSVPVKHSEGAFTFTLADKEGSKMNVIHRGTKPQNFEHTEQVVLLGRYKSDSGLFEADKVLVKCPSKYRRQQ